MGLQRDGHDWATFTFTFTSFAQWQYHSQWSLSKAWLLLIENFSLLAGGPAAQEITWACCWSLKLKLAWGQSLWNHSVPQWTWSIKCQFQLSKLFYFPHIFIIYLFIVLIFLVMLHSMYNLVPWPGIEHETPVLTTQNPNLWTTREVPLQLFSPSVPHFSELVFL